MHSQRFFYYLLAASAAAAVASAAASGRRRQVPLEPAGPFARDLVATGYVEKIHKVPGGCMAQIAVYEWQDLSPGFPLAERPQRDDRFTVLGSEAYARALFLARAISEGHIAFRIAESASQWYFMESPQPALGCAGFMDDWAPGPMRRVL